MTAPHAPGHREGAPEMAPPGTCQLHDLPEAGLGRGLADQVAAAAEGHVRAAMRRGAKALRDPFLVPRRVASLLAGGASLGPPPAGEQVRPAPLRLAPGERVRVKSYERILDTLDPRWTCEGLGFMAEMRPYCGQVHTVRAVVRRFFDERTRRMLKLRGVVILDDVICHPAADADSDYAGCQRHCFLFWKEAWLERLP